MKEEIMPGRLQHGVVALCALPQKSTKLPVSRDDNLDVSGVSEIMITNAQYIIRTGHIMLHHSSEYLEVDTHRISTLRTQLDENSYIVNSRQIADKIIDFELALSERNKSPC